MITTEGFRDILHIARHKKPFNFSLQQELPWQSRPLVKRRHRLTVKERVTVPHGEVLVPLDEDEVRTRVRALETAGVEAIAVCLLHCYLNPDHEQRDQGDRARGVPRGVPLRLERGAAALPRVRAFLDRRLNAYVGPKVARYVARFDEAMRTSGFAHGVQLMQSSGGMTTVDSAAQRPVNLLMSGAVAGLIGGIWAGRMAGFDERRHARHRRHVGRHRRRRRRRAAHAASARYEGRRLPGDGADGRHRHDRRRRRLDRLRRRGRRVPRRAAVGGRRPRPRLLRARRRAADLDRRAAVLGRLRPDRGLLGGDMHLDADRAERRCAPLARELGMSVEEAALGALQIQSFGMTQAIELNSVRRGYDPRDFTLVAAGGAGRCSPATSRCELEIPRCSSRRTRASRRRPACSTTDLQHEFVATDRHALDDLDHARLAAPLRRDRRRRRARSSTHDGVPEDRRLVRRLADCRYAGQGYEVRCDAPAGAVDAPGSRSCGALPRARTRPSTATASTRRSRSSTSTRSASAAIDELAPAADRGRRRRPCASADAGARGRLRRGGRAADRAARRSSTASCCAPATASPARRSSSSTTRRRCPARASRPRSTATATS